MKRRKFQRTVKETEKKTHEKKDEEGARGKDE